jgi:hypothetical protein
VEGLLDAMDDPGTGYDIPVLTLYNQVKGRTFLTTKAVMTLLGALVPEIHDIDAREQKFLHGTCQQARRQSDLGGFQGLPQTG